MTLTWLLNAMSLFTMAAGSLLFFLSLWRTPRAGDRGLPADQELRGRKDRRIVAVGGVLLSLWFVMQYLFIIML